MATTIKYRAPALDKGLDILELLSRTSSLLSFGEIARGVGHSKSQIFRMLQVLEERKYIERGEGDTGYRLTNRLFMLGMERPQNKDLVETALPIMHRLSDEILHPCHLAVASEDQMVVVARVDAPSDLGFVVRIGYRRSIAHSTSGAVLYAFQGEETRARWLEMLDEKGVSYKRKSFIERTDQVRKQGYGSFPSEAVDGVVDLSAPILQHDHAIGAVAIPFLDRHPTKITIKHALARLRAAVEDISQRLTA